MWSPFLPAVLACFGMAGRRGSPTSSRASVRRQQEPERGPCSAPGQAAASNGENTETPSLLFLASCVCIYQNAGFQSIL